MWGKYLAPVGMLSPGAIVTLRLCPSLPTTKCSHLLICYSSESNKDSKPQTGSSSLALPASWKSELAAQDWTRLLMPPVGCGGGGVSGKGLLLWVGMGLMTSQNVLQPKILFRTQETQALTTHPFSTKNPTRFLKGVMQEGGYPEPLTTHLLQSSLDMSAPQGPIFPPARDNRPLLNSPAKALSPFYWVQKRSSALKHVCPSQISYQDPPSLAGSLKITYFSWTMASGVLLYNQRGLSENSFPWHTQFFLRGIPLI